MFPKPFFPTSCEEKRILCACWPSGVITPGDMSHMSNEQHVSVRYLPHLLQCGGQKLEHLGQDKHSHPCQQTASYLSCGRLWLIKEKVRMSLV